MASGAVAVWSSDITFNAFEGKTGGFEVDGNGRVVLQNGQNGGSGTRAYDLFNTGGTKPVSGQDGRADVWIRSQVVDGSNGRWADLVTEKRRDNLQAHATVLGGTSRSGDYGVVAMEFTLSSDLRVTAGELAIQLASLNGRGDLYEWTFVTVGGVEDAPFDLSAIGRYTAGDYSRVPGDLLPGTGRNNDVYANGVPMSQFLQGNGSSKPVNGLVQNGWWSADGFNVNVSAAEEAAPNNPKPAGGSFGGSGTVTGMSLGLGSDQEVSRFTVWFGFHDVGFDTNGDGFTQTETDQVGAVTSLRVGSTLSGPLPVPEPAAAAIVPLALVFLLRRRRPPALHSPIPTIQ